MTATAEANDAIRFAFAWVTAVANNETELAAELLTECEPSYALGVAGVALREALDEGEGRWPGFRDEVLAVMGVAFSDVYEDGELDT